MKRLKHANLMMITLILVVGLAAAPTQATLIRHTFSGTITTIELGQPPAPWDGVHLGSAWEVSYVFDTETPDLDQGNPNRGRYFIEYGSVAIDGVSQDAAFGMIEVLNQFVDSYTVTFFDLPLGDGDVFLGGSNAIDSDQIPIDIDLTAWDQIQQFEFGSGVFQFQLFGIVESFQSEIVPSPPAFMLGIVSLLLFRKRHRHVRSC